MVASLASHPRRRHTNDQHRADMSSRSVCTTTVG